MRVGRFSLARLRDGEEGAVLAIVAITLLVLTGMLVLTFDLGRGVALKRNMVNAADAGALAAARECGLANGDVSARNAADRLVADNNDAATVTGFEIDPDPAVCRGAGNPDPDGKNTVTVTVTVPQEYFFAQIFGFDSGDVVASATAIWEAGYVNPPPLKLDQLKVDECLTDSVEDDTCMFAFENDAHGSQYRGVLNFPEGWPVADPNPMTCNSQTGGSRDLRDYIMSMGSSEAGAFKPVLWAQPVNVCASPRVSGQVVVKAIRDWLAIEDHPDLVVPFPVVACDGFAPPCYTWQNTPGLSYPVVDFVGLKIVDAWHSQEARRHCTFTGHSSDVFCIQLAKPGPNDPTMSGGVTVRLVD
jgi:Flp pilus assembly protein TadG